MLNGWRDQFRTTRYRNDLLRPPQSSGVRPNNSTRDQIRVLLRGCDGLGTPEPNGPPMRPLGLVSSINQPDAVNTQETLEPGARGQVGPVGTRGRRPAGACSGTIRPVSSRASAILDQPAPCAAWRSSSCAIMARHSPLPATSPGKCTGPSRPPWLSPSLASIIAKPGGNHHARHDGP